MFPRVAKKMSLQAMSLLNTLCFPAEWIMTRGGGRATGQPLIFIIGPPRCGSTLVYQSLVAACDVGYFSNLHAAFFAAPTLIERLARPAAWRGGESYQSRLGATRGWSAPSEAGRFWYRFFPRQFGGDARLSPVRRRQLARAVRCFADACRRPVVFKNLFSTVRLLELGDLFPEARFLVVRRDEIDVAHSLLEARWKRFGRYDAWLSVPPPHFQSLEERPCHEQVIEQVRGLYALIDQRKPAMGQSRFAELRYERFCQEPRRQLEQLREALSANGVELRRRLELPASFSPRTSVRIDPGLYERMVDYAHATS